MAEPRRYAEGTSVPVEKSKAELDVLLGKHGATQRATYVDDDTGRAAVQFRVEGRMVRLELRVNAPDLPDPKSADWQQKTKCPQGWNRWAVSKRQEWRKQRIEQAEREAWRRLLLVTKAKLELVQQGDSTIEREFLADILLPDGRTVHEALKGGLEHAYLTGNMPPLLPGRSES